MNLSESRTSNGQPCLAEARATVPETWRSSSQSQSRSRYIRPSPASPMIASRRCISRESFCRAQNLAAPWTRTPSRPGPPRHCAHNGAFPPPPVTGLAPSRKDNPTDPEIHAHSWLCPRAVRRYLDSSLPLPPDCRLQGLPIADKTWSHSDSPTSVQFRSCNRKTGPVVHPRDTSERLAAVLPPACATLSPQNSFPKDDSFVLGLFQFYREDCSDTRERSVGSPLRKDQIETKYRIPTLASSDRLCRTLACFTSCSGSQEVEDTGPQTCTE